MDRGSYVAASGGLAQQRHLDIVSNNLANVSTVGFKAERVVTRQQEFTDTLASAMDNAPQRAKLDHEATPGVVDVQTVTDFSPGPVAYTGDPLNVALSEGNTFFVVQTPDGEAYTRAGNFTKNVEGELVTPDGYPVMGEGGPLALPEGAASIIGDGNIIANGESVGRLRVVKFDDTSVLTRTGGVRFVSNDGTKPVAVPAVLVPASVEMPNVNAVQSMVDLINANKGFEAYSKTMVSIDEINDRAIQLAKVQS